MNIIMHRSFEPISKDDLNKLLNLAFEEHEAFFKRKPKYEPFYKNNLLAIILGQGAALHYLDNKYGVKDFDIYLFYKEHPQKNMQIRRTKKGESNLEKFGNPKIDFIKKVVKTKYIEGNEGDTKKIITRLLNESRASIVKYLTIQAKKCKNRKRNVVVGLHPESIFGKILWDGEVTKFR